MPRTPHRHSRAFTLRFRSQHCFPQARVPEEGSRLPKCRFPVCSEVAGRLLGDGRCQPDVSGVLCKCWFCYCASSQPIRAAHGGNYRIERKSDGQHVDLCADLPVAYVFQDLGPVRGAPTKPSHKEHRETHELQEQQRKDQRWDNKNQSHGMRARRGHPVGLRQKPQASTGQRRGAGSEAPPVLLQRTE